MENNLKKSNLKNLLTSSLCSTLVLTGCSTTGRNKMNNSTIPDLHISTNDHANVTYNGNSNANTNLATTHIIPSLCGIIGSATGAFVGDYISTTALSDNYIPITHPRPCFAPSSMTSVAMTCCPTEDMMANPEINAIGSTVGSAVGAVLGTAFGIAIYKNIKKWSFYSSKINTTRRYWTTHSSCKTQKEKENSLLELKEVTSSTP